MSTRIRTEDDVAAEAPKLSDSQLEAIDVDSVFANADFNDPSADASDLRAVSAAFDALEQSRAALDAAVESARSRGRSWARIGGLLGVSRQAAQQRFRHIDAAARAH